MRYHPALDGAPSSVTSTLFALISSLVSTVGCFYVLFRLHRLRKAPDARWRARHFLIFLMTAANLVMAAAALISGGFFLVYGRISLSVGCTIGGMVELWAQQAVDVCAVLVTLFTFASLRRHAQWDQRRYWIQSNAAPVFGLVVFLPLVSTIVAQIVWRFRSSEFTYCWIPRMPVYARWIAVDGWRTVFVLGILAAYLVMAGIAFRARSARFSDASSRPVMVSVPRAYSAIDSGPASNVTENRGLFSQSIYNIHNWARSRLGRSTAARGTGTGRRGLRARADASVPVPLPNAGLLYHVDTTGEQQYSSSESRSYYEQFKRSVVHNIVRWFTITTDIPSPTIPQSIFDDIGKDAARFDGVFSSDTTHCEICSYFDSPTTTSRAVANDSACCSDLEVDMDKYMDSHPRGLRRWCSAITRLVSKPSLALSAVAKPLHQGVRLRRSHTTPAMARQDMGLCNCVFKRPRTPRPGATILQPETFAACVPSPAQTQVQWPCSVKQRRLVTDKVQEIFGYGLHDSPASAVPHHSIYTCANRNIENYMPSVCSDEESARIVNIEGIEKLSSLEEGRWDSAVSRCRSGREFIQQQQSRPRISRLFVYPLAYIVVWLPSLVYFLVSTYVYYTAFAKTPVKRSVDMSGLPGRWVPETNANYAWPYFRHASTNVSGSGELYWLAIIQALHLLNGAIDGVLFWATESA